MKNKGFTLMELLGVIMILAILALITFPPIIEEIKKSKSEIKGTTKVLIIDAAKDYYADNINNYETYEGITYCININTLSEQGYLNKKIKDENLNDINTSKNVKLVYHNAKFDYDVVDSCTYYTVTFDANGGNVDIDSKEVIENSVYGTLPTPTRAGYTFMGWNGKNMFELKENIDWSLSGEISANSVENSVTLIGTNWVLGEYYLPTLKANTTYSISGNVELINYHNTYIRITKERAKTNNNTFLLNMTTVNNGYFHSSFTINDSDEPTAALALYGNIGNSTETRTIVSNIQIEEGNTATEYEPYYVTSETKVTRNYNHTLKAIWKENE